MSKVCFKCGMDKPLEAFYAHPKMADGRLGKCKECTRADVKSNREIRKDYYQLYDRKRASIPKRVAARESYRMTDAYKEAHRKALKKWDANNRERRKAQIAVSNAVRDGRLVKQLCHVCGDANVEAHHPDYSRPLDVVWLCVGRHSQLHTEHNETVRQLELVHNLQTVAPATFM